MSSYLMSSSSSAASSPIASKSLETSGASWRFGSRTNFAASPSDAASASQAKLKDAYLGGLKEKQQGDLPHEREEKSGKKLAILNLSHGITGLLLKIMKLVGNHLQEDHQNSCLQNFRKVSKIRKRLGTIVFNHRYPQFNLRMPSFLWSGISMGNIMMKA